MKNQIRLFVLGMVVFSSVQGFAASATTHFSCLINKSNTLTVSFKSIDGAVQSVELRTKNFMGENDEHVVTLLKPSLQLIEYGNVMMVTQDFGRSGYVFLRFERKSATQYDGLIDVNYFQNQAFSTGGNLTSMPCFNYGSSDS
ncbi:hypothetical protein WDW86_22490 [Bdellovibrionota bacterium FG-2]